MDPSALVLQVPIQALEAILESRKILRESEHFGIAPGTFLVHDVDKGLLISLQGMYLLVQVIDSHLAVYLANPHLVEFLVMLKWPRGRIKLLIHALGLI